MQVLWRTGSVSTFTVERPRKEAWSQPSPDLISTIAELFAAGKTDEEIANEVERRGLRPVGRWHWGAWSVPPHPQAAAPPSAAESRRAHQNVPTGLLSLRGVAVQLAVSLRVVRYWIEKGLLKPAEGGGLGRTRWFVLDAPTLRRLEDASLKTISQTPRQSSLRKGGHCE